MIKNGRVPLYQDTDGRKILYISSVALQLSGANHPKSTGFVRDIASYLSTSLGEFINVKLVSPAWIYIELTDYTLATWLNFLIDRKNPLDGTQETNQVNTQHSKVKIAEIQPQDSRLKNIELCFQVQYAHARCCSLLRLADREGLIKIVQSSKNQLNLRSDQTIPWLNCEQKLSLVQPEELALIQLLVKTVDDLVFPDTNKPVNWNTAALRLSSAFESFWCNCRIWGEVKIKSLELAQARLGLLIATQLVLKSVLETQLGVVAPVEL